MKKRTSTPLMIEKPVSSPSVPPMAESLSTSLAFWSLILVYLIFDEKKLLIIINLLTLVTLSNVEVSKKILTKWSLLLNFKSLKIILIYISYFCFLFLPLRS